MSVVDPGMLTTPPPDLADFELHKVVYDVDFAGVRVPGACAAFYRCTDGARIRSVGVYMLNGTELFRAWGYTDDEHCSFHLVPLGDPAESDPHPGCPDVRALRDGERVTGIAVRTRAGEHRVPVTRGEALAIAP